MSELENIKPVAFYRADWKGDMMFRKDNTVVIRKNEGDFTTGWIKPLYDELPEPQPQLTIPKSIADELEEEIEEAYSNDYIRSYSDVGAYMEVITDGLDEDSELYKFMFPDNDALLGCSHRNIIYLYLVDNDLVKVVEV